MQSRYAEFVDAGAEIVAISTGDVATAKQYAEHHGFEFPLLSDPELAAIRAYGLLHEDGGLDGDIARPATLILDAEGRIAWRHLTDDWRVRPRPAALLETVRGLP